MGDYDSSPDKTSGYDPATVELDDGRIIDAAHHITNDRAQLLHLYIDGRDGGIDVTVPLGDSDVTAYAQSDLGEEVLGFDTDDDDQDAAGDDRVVADGGRDVPPCECGADLLRTAELTTAEAPDAGARQPCPSMHKVPDAECTNCSRSVGAMYGGTAAIAVWEARGESPPGDDDDDDRRVFRVGAGDPPVFDDDDEDDGRLMTDGGTPYRIDPTPNERPIVPDNPVDVTTFDAVECGDRVTAVDGTLEGHVIVTRVAEMHQHPDQNVIEYVTADGARTRAEVYEGRQIPVCSRCGDIVLPDAGYVASHGDDCCNDDGDDDDRTDGGHDQDAGECDNPLCNADASDIECRRGGVYCSTECRSIVNDARGAADARFGYGSLLMPSGDRETVGAVLAALNVNDAIDPGGD